MGPSILTTELYAKKPLQPLNMTLGGSLSRSRCLGAEKYFLSLTGIEFQIPGHPARITLAIKTELTRPKFVPITHLKANC